MADIKLDYVNSFCDARGKPRHQFRRKGHKKVTIKGRPGTPEFMDHYHALLEGTGGPMSVAEIGASRTTAGTIDALIARYLKHDVFKKGLAPASQAWRRPILDHFREFRTPSGRRYGDNRLATIQKKNIIAVLEGKTSNPQRNWLKTLRHLITFAIAQSECSVDPTAGIKPLKGIKSMGHMTWKPPQVAQYRERHAVGTTARLALELMLNIAARREDAHKIGRPHLSFDPDLQLWKLTWRPSKTLRSTTRR
jgi:integrase/recombinase XerD